MAAVIPCNSMKIGWFGAKLWPNFWTQVIQLENGDKYNARRQAMFNIVVLKPGSILPTDLLTSFSNVLWLGRLNFSDKNEYAAVLL